MHSSLQTQQLRRHGGCSRVCTHAGINSHNWCVLSIGWNAEFSLVPMETVSSSPVQSWEELWPTSVTTSMSLFVFQSELGTWHCIHWCTRALVLVCLHIRWASPTRRYWLLLRPETLECVCLLQMSRRRQAASSTLWSWSAMEALWV